jgi:glycine/D-amino acid oxidase-like deaminating enzyme
MRDLFRRTLGRVLDIARQDVIMVAPPGGSVQYDAEQFPSWIDHHYPAYGIPAAGGHGFKAVIVWRQLTVDIDTDDRLVGPSSIARTRRYLAHRFPELAERPIVGQEVGQIANTADTHFLIDRHPEHPDVVLVAGDSGHLFKHGPVAGDHIAEVALGRRAPDKRFALRHRGSVALQARPQ